MNKPQPRKQHKKAFELKNWKIFLTLLLCENVHSMALRIALKNYCCRQLNLYGTLGMFHEFMVYLWLKYQRGYTVQRSTRRQDIKQGIDFILPKQNISLSFKTQLDARETFIFELEVYSRLHRDWLPSWYYHTVADYYVVMKNYRLYAINRRKLIKHVERCGWDFCRELSNDTRAKQVASGHDHINAKLGLIHVRTLVSRGIAYELR